MKMQRDSNQSKQSIQRPSQSGTHVQRLGEVSLQEVHVTAPPAIGGLDTGSTFPTRTLHKENEPHSSTMLELESSSCTTSTNAIEMNPNDSNNTAQNKRTTQTSAAKDTDNDNNNGTNKNNANNKYHHINNSNGFFFNNQSRMLMGGAKPHLPQHHQQPHHHRQQHQHHPIHPQANMNGALNGSPPGPSFVALQPVAAGQMHPHPQFQFYTLGNNMHNHGNVPTFYGSMPPPFAIHHSESGGISMRNQLSNTIRSNAQSASSTTGEHKSSTNILDSMDPSPQHLERINNQNVNNSSKVSCNTSDSIIADSKNTNKEQSASAFTKKRVERDVLWMNQYNALRAFYEENGHANVPMHYTTNKRLGHWINNQRQLYRKYRAGLPSSMTEKRIELLEALNFAWVLGKDWKQKQRAKEKLEELTASVKLPTNNGSSNSLSNMSSSQSAENTILHSTNMTEKDVDQLDDQSLLSSSSSSSTTKEMIATLATTQKRKFDETEKEGEWHIYDKGPQKVPVHEPVLRVESSAPIKKRFVLMNEEKSPTKQMKRDDGIKQSIQSKNSDKSPPSIVQISSLSSSQDGSPKAERPELVERQCLETARKDFVGLIEGTDNSQGLTVQVHQKMSHEGNDGSKSLNDDSSKVPAKLSDLQWHKHLTHLSDFKATYGHCNVPFQYTENKSLGYWVHNQRQVYKKWLRGEPCSLTQSRIDSLTELGFSLKSQRTLKKEKNTSETQTKAMEGEQNSIGMNDESNIYDATEGKSESEEKAESAKAYKDDSSSNQSMSNISCISPGNSNIPADVAIPLVIRKQPEKADIKVKIDAFDVLWNRRLAELRDFHLNNGHSDVPSNYPPNKPLGIWAMNQRQQYRKYKNDEKSSLTPQRIAALETLHFRWYLGKGTRGKDKAGRKQGTSPVPRNRKNIDNQTAVFKSTDDVVPNSELSNFTDDLIYIILSYLPCIRSVVSFCTTSRRFVRILWSIHMEQICKSLYITNYGFEGLNLHNEATPYYWKQAWQNMYCFRRALKTQAILDEVIVDNQNECHKQRNRLGILSPTEEDEAIFYDNPLFAPTNLHEHSLGYFGLSKFYVKVSSFLPGHNDYYKEFCAVCGDFNGLRILDSPLYQNYSSRMQCRSIGDTGFGQVLTLLAPPTKHSVLCPCLYLGCASGSVLAVSSRSDPNLGITFQITSICFSHSNETTALAWLPGRNSEYNSEFLVSGGCDGNVYIYPDALSVAKNFDLNNRILCCANNNQVPILSLATCKVESRDHWFQVLFTGDSDGNIILWNSQPFTNSLTERLRPLPTFTSIKIVNSCDNCRITSLKVVNDKTLIAGDTSGNVRVWDVFETETDVVHHGRKVTSQHTPDLSILFKIPAAHGGTIEKIEVVGNVLLTTGGSDGFVRGWELKCGDLIGSVSCHPGIHLNQGFVPSLKSSVVGFLFDDSKTSITLCRDGSLHLWNYGAVSNQEVHFQIRKLSWDATTQEIECGVIPAAAVLSNLAGTTTSALLIPHSNPPAKALGLQALKRIMTYDGNSHPTKEQKNLRDRMRLAIIKAAYEHASNPDWQRFPETPFIGADGKVYRYIKKAFATFSGMRPCQVCRRSNRGAYYCRLQLKHDSSDVDDPGHNSLNTLRSVIHRDSTSQFHRASAVAQEDMQIEQFVSKNVDNEEFTLESQRQQSSSSSSVQEDSRNTVNIATEVTWECHKCQRINLEKNKRCPSCSAWKGGKRNSFSTTAKKNKTQKSTCYFCQHTTNFHVNQCEMCHEPFPMKTATLPFKESMSKCGSKDSDEQVKDSQVTTIPPQKVVVKVRWKCHKCDRVNPSTSKRCKSCLAWRGGTRQLNFTKRKNEGK